MTLFWVRSSHSRRHNGHFGSTCWLLNFAFADCRMYVLVRILALMWAFLMSWRFGLTEFQTLWTFPISSFSTTFPDVDTYFAVNSCNQYFWCPCKCQIQMDFILKTTLNNIIDYKYATFNVNRSAFHQKILVDWPLPELECKRGQPLLEVPSFEE